MWEGDWNARIVGIDALPKVSAATAVVIAVRTREAQGDAELWANSRALNAKKDESSGTIVFLSGMGSDEVLPRTA